MVVRHKEKRSDRKKTFNMRKNENCVQRSKKKKIKLLLIYKGAFTVHIYAYLHIQRDLALLLKRSNAFE